MTSANGEKRLLSSRWMWGFMFLFLTHAALVFWLGDRTRPRPFGSRPEPFIYIAATEEAQAVVAERMQVNDPTIFALPNAAGFSGNAWLNFTPPREAPGKWSEPPQPLPLPTHELGSTFAAIVATNRPSASLLLDHLRVYVPTELDSPSEPIARASSFVLRGPLTARRVVAAPPMPSAQHTDFLTNTVIEIAVNGHGVVESAVLLGECGLKSMDEHALKASWSLRFAPLAASAREREEAPPTRGRLIFTWHVVPPGATNTTAALTQ